MSRVEMAIEFDEPTLMYEGGAPIQGQVVVRVHEQTECKGLDIELGWRSTGRGALPEHVAFKQMLFVGQWAIGEHRYAFQCHAPQGPYTYRGHYLNVDWYARARVDVPWARDPSVEQHFGVRPSTTPVTL